MELSSLLRDSKATDLRIHDTTGAPPTHHSNLRRPIFSPADPTDTTVTKFEMSPESYARGQPASGVPYNSTNGSPTAHIPKSIEFQLLLQPQTPQYKARLPMRVSIFPHDATESIMSTVVNFFGLYGKAISMEDENGHILISRYENLQDNMVVYVRVIEDASTGMHAAEPYPSGYYAGSPGVAPYYTADGNHMPPPQPAQALSYGQPLSRPTSRASYQRSISPRGRGRRSTSVNPPPLKKSRSRPGFKSRGSSTHGGSFADAQSDALNGYSSGDGAPGSVSSKTKSEHLGNTEISLDNIVEGGRRKRAKFESSELPLFAPPQMPAATSNSSVSPARRNDHHRSSFPFTNPSHNPFSNPQTLQSPQSFGNDFGQPGLYSTPAAQGRRTRGAISDPSHRRSLNTLNGAGILPTPDPTVGSCMSEEDKDVALQLMRLGEMSNISHGRTSASTLDDTFSGKADAASSTGVTSDSESDDELPPARRQKLETSPTTNGALSKFGQHLHDILPSQESTEPSGDEVDYEDGRDATFRPGIQDGTNDEAKARMPKSKSVPALLGKPRTSVAGAKVKSNKSKSSQVKSKKSISAPGSKPISPTSIPSLSRKTSNASALNFQHPLGTDEEDLSSKPRCQRCRKSKKGCDRQRPCQRCKDAGLSADQCVSEDEGNGRKGRYGRHMGVSVKKDELAVETGVLPSGLVAGGQVSPDKSKKRKR